MEQMKFFRSKHCFSCSFWQKRWGLLLLGISSSCPISVVLSAFFAAPGLFVPVALNVWWLSLLGPLSNYVIYGGQRGEDPQWLLLALVCLPLMVAHPVKPRAATAWLTIIGFCGWYYFAVQAMLGAVP
jgi:hypothetical protein